MVDVCCLACREKMEMFQSVGWRVEGNSHIFLISNTHFLFVLPLAAYRSYLKWKLRACIWFATKTFRSGMTQCRHNDENEIAIRHYTRPENIFGLSWERGCRKCNCKLSHSKRLHSISAVYFIMIDMQYELCTTKRVPVMGKALGGRGVREEVVYLPKIPARSQ